MSKFIAVIGTLDTKGDQIEYLKQRIEARGHKAIVIDVGVMGPVPFEPTFRRERVAGAIGLGLEEIKALGQRVGFCEKMAEGAREIVKELYARDELDGVVAVGGTHATSVAVPVMKEVPLFIPKLLVTTIAFGPTLTPDIVGGNDMMMLPWVGGLWGLNSFSKRCLETAAGAICGAAEEYDRKKVVEKRKIVGASGMGFTKFYDYLKPALAERGYELAVFHSTGMSTRIMERAIADGIICASLDLYAAQELTNELYGGASDAGKQRLEVAGKMGIPQIVSGMPGVWQWPTGKPLPPQYADRVPRVGHIIHEDIDPTPEECVAVGKLMAQKLNMATGPTALVLPEVWVKAPPGAPPERVKLVESFRINMKAFRDSVKKDINPKKVKVVELEGASSLDPQFVDAVLTLFDEMMPR
jgi:uncharacterized protein (UPF0261 family)